MRRILLSVTDELADVIDEACGDRYRNPTIEDWLWRIGEIRETAKRKKLRRRERPVIGRPKSLEGQNGKH